MVQTDQGNSRLTLCRGGGGGRQPPLSGDGLAPLHRCGPPRVCAEPAVGARISTGLAESQMPPSPTQAPQLQPHALPKPVALAIFTQACRALGRPLLSRTHLQQTQTPSCNLCLPTHLQAPPGTPPAPCHPHTCRTRPGPRRLLCLLPLLGVTELKCQLPNIQNVPLPQHSAP